MSRLKRPFDAVDQSEKEEASGWHLTDPIPDGHVFEENVMAKNGRLFFHGIDLAQLADGQVTSKEGTKIPGKHNSLSLRYLPAIRTRVKRMIERFERAKTKLGYEGDFIYAYASKANAMKDVMQAAEDGGAHQETSAVYDLYVLLHQETLLPPERLVICNGFKLPGTKYAELLCHLIHKHQNTIPIIDDVSEVQLYASLKTQHKIKVGLRLKCWGKFASAIEMANCDCRFGFTLEQALEVAEEISKHPNLELKILHCMVGSPVLEEDIVKFVAPLEAYAQFRKKFPSCDTFDFGGGMPSALVLTDSIDYDSYVERLLSTVQTECAKHGVPHPHLLGEFGRYTVADHEVHLFKVVSVRDNGSPYPYYVINGSVMSSFPDTWGLKEKFTCLPLNHLDKPFRPVKLGGATCDSDDMYPPHYTNTKLYLPNVRTEDHLWVAFFNVGAYQEMLGGVGGTKHCGIPESDSVVVTNVSEDGRCEFKQHHGQTLDVVCQRLQYRFKEAHHLPGTTLVNNHNNNNHNNNNHHHHHIPKVTPTI
jgi:arginine decarboxylase